MLQKPLWLSNLIDKTLIKLGLKQPEPFEKKSVFIITAISAILLISTVVTTIQVLQYHQSQKNQNTGENTDNLETVNLDIPEETPVTIEPLEDTEAKAPEKDAKTLSFLLIGYGGAGHSGGMLSDVIQLVHINFEKSKIHFISIPRDLLVELPNGQTYKINTAFSVGGGPNPIASGGKLAKQMASVVTGLKVDYFLAVDFVGFERLVGYELRNIDVDVTTPFEDPWYPVRGLEQETCGKSPEEIAELTRQYSGFELEKQFPCRYEHLKFEKKTYTMDGGTALKYVRSRHGTGAGDFSRSERQHDVLRGMRKRLLTLEALTKAPEFYKKFTKHVATDIDTNILEAVVPFMNSAKDYEIKNTILSTTNVFKSGKSKNGAYVLLPKSGDNDWSEVHSFIQSQL